MQIVLTRECVMDQSHSLSLHELPIETGERFTVLILKERPTEGSEARHRRKVFAHRFRVDDINLPARDVLHER